MATITNSQVNTAAAAVPSPYGPFTRVTDMTTLPVPNDMIQIELVDNNGNTISMSYNELADAVAVQAALAKAYGKQYVLHALINQVNGINTTLQTIRNSNGQGYTDAEYRQVIDLLRSINEVSGYLSLTSA